MGGTYPAEREPIEECGKIFGGSGMALRLNQRLPQSNNALELTISFILLLGIAKGTFGTTVSNAIPAAEFPNKAKIAMIG